MINIKRSGGILLHISSLNGKYGIGTLGSEAYQFVDFLKASNIKIWQILPLNPTDVGNSPYQCFSAFAGNHLFIDLDDLYKFGLLNYVDLKFHKNKFNDIPNVDFDLVISHKNILLKKAFNVFILIKDKFLDYADFCSENKIWLNDYALFMSLKKYHKNISISEWELSLRRKNIESIDKIKSDLEEEIEYQKFLQYIFFLQWYALKKYANDSDVKILGDMPIYVSYNSADVWSNRELFELDDEVKPIKVAGVPPDLFSETGQLWGNPVYNWNNNKNENFAWWISRFDFAFKMYDLVRIDHFRGFSSFWSIDANEETAINGEWVEAPGYELFNIVSKKFGDLPIIAEDLGIITPEVELLRDNFNFMGMKILQFAFGSAEDNKYLPRNYIQNCAVFTGTHDNNTSLGWFKNCSTDEREYILNYINCEDGNIVWSLIRLAWSSNAKIAIAPMQDFLQLDESARMNTPSTISGNWQWKMISDDIYEKLILKIRKLNEVYWR